jgi:hypothetical protein
MRLCPLQGTTHLARRRLASFLQSETRPAAPLLEFGFPSTLQPERVHSTPAYLTGYVPPTGFLTLSTGYSSPERPALFHASNAHGIPRHSPGVFPHHRGPLTRRQRTTLLTFSRDFTTISAETEPAPSSRRRHAVSRETRLQLLRLQGFPSSGSVFHARSLILPRNRSPPELSSSLGSRSRSESRRAQRSRSHALSRPSPNESRQALQHRVRARMRLSGCIHERGAPPSRAGHPLLRFLSLPPPVPLRAPRTTRVTGLATLRPFTLRCRKPPGHLWVVVLYRSSVR